jgi:hypothetical protein
MTMNPPSSDIAPVSPPAVLDRPAAPPARDGGPPARHMSGADFLVRLLLTVVLLVGYFWLRGDIVRTLQAPFRDFLIAPTPEAPAFIHYAIRGVKGLIEAMGVWLVAGLLFSLVFLWRKTLAKDKRFHAPLLVTSILLLGDAAASILELHHVALLSRLTGGLLTAYSPTLVTILITMLAESLLGRFYYGKWPHPASAYVSGISAGILIKSPELWPFVMCGLLSITSKYVLRIGDRHIWNPTNLGVTMMLFLAPEHVHPLGVEWGNEIWAVLVIWCLGGLILYNLGLVHIPVAFVLTFVPLSFFRAWYTGDAVMTELAPMTSPMFQLFIFFMITDPKTITKKRWSQILVAVLVGIAETILRLAFRDRYSLFHSLFIVGPIANLVEIGYLYWTGKGKKPAQAPASGALAPAKA